MRLASSTTSISIKEVTEEATSIGPEINILEITEISPKVTVDDSKVTINALNTTNGENVKSEKVEKSTQSIKTILIGLKKQTDFRIKHF